jgi:hypothetical protein
LPEEGEESVARSFHGLTADATASNGGCGRRARNRAGWYRG